MTSKSWGQSLGITMKNTRLVEGCLYKDVDKAKYKIFPWEKICGVTPEEGDLTEDDANPYYATSYGSTDKKYELIKARIAGESEPVEIGIGNVLQWFGATKKYGAKSASKTLTKILTTPGEDLLNDTDDNHNWLHDTNETNLLRGDLEGRTFDMFLRKRDASDSDNTYFHPTVVDVELGRKVKPSNSSGGSSNGSKTDVSTESSGTLGGESDQSDDTDDVPGPVNDFFATADRLDMDESGKVALLDDLIVDEENELTQDMIEEAGGRDNVLAQA
ncbi:hypothetical protein ACFQL7_20635 [Halocatena marina]|uniref:Uncharacterized protein n=2 Tax=Halocatena marina TaxID=2934937 RepID=A0ABD5YRL5_9EURY